MKILVCIKQVPGTSQVEVDEKTGVLKRDGVESKMNPFDLFAIEQALQIKGRYGGSVDVITMGPPQAKSVLEEAVYMGADKGALISDRSFAGADVVATSYTLSQGIRRMGSYDLILCGKQTTDGDTAQVGPETAEFLGIEHVTNVRRILCVEEGYLTVEANLDTCLQHIRLKCPCLLTIEKDSNTPRLPSYRRKLAADPEQVCVYTLKEFADSDPSHYGLKGSPTQVERIFPPEHNAAKKLLVGSGEMLTLELLKILREKKFM